MPKRDNDYYLKQLRTKHSIVYADLQAGKYSSPGEAFRAVGLKKRRTRLQELKNSWVKASTTDRENFDDWRKSLTAVLSSHIAPAATSVLPTIATDRRLTPWAKARIEHLMHALNLSRGEVMDELGFPRLNTSLASALRRDWRLDPTLLLALERWLQANSAVK